MLIRCSLKFACTSFSVLTFLVPSVHAQASRTWVSGVGDDVNPCSRTAPCKTWAGAISKTAAGGEIDALDPGGFGSLTITKAIKIEGTPFIASALAAGVNGIVISAGVNDVVTLHGIQISGNNTAGTSRGVVLNTAAALIIENCEIFGFGQRGVSIQPTNDDAKVSISDTNIVGGLSNGVVIQPTGLRLNVALDNVHVQQNVNFGVSITANSTVSIRNSVISNNGLSGLRVDGTGGAAILDLDNVEIAGNSIGIESVAGSTTRVSNSTIIQNANGFVFGGTIQSYGTNRVAGNGGNNSGMSSIALQ